MSRNQQHIRKLAIISVFWLLCWVPSNASDVLGLVKDAETGKALAGANVVLLGGEGTTSNQKGEFKLQELNEGTHTLFVSHIGKSIEQLHLQLGEKDTSLTILLKDEVHDLEAVTITESRETGGLAHLHQVENMAIYASKKNELVHTDELVMNKATGNSRQLFAKVSGLNIWESGNAGIQLGIGGRGLSPNRSSNFNTRQNGYDISADALGYPESYYTPPLEAVDRIELVRGAASLQYGTQFGGMLNFRLKEGALDKKAAFEARVTTGSFGLWNAFTSVGGTVGKLNYYTFYQYKRNKGFRPNAELNQHAAHLGLRYQFSEKLLARLEFTHLSYLNQQAGGLTDAQFTDDPTQSNRARNWFHINWNIASLGFDYQVNRYWQLRQTFFGLLATKDALGVLSNIHLADFGEPRDLLKDRFRNWGTEFRSLYRYSTFDMPSTFLVGYRFYQGHTLRRQGLGSDGSQAEFAYLNPEYLEGSDFELPSTNLAFFAENVFNINKKWSVTPGARWEWIKTSSDGYYRNTMKDLAGNVLVDERIDEQKTSTRQLVLLGLGVSFRPQENIEAYLNFSQNYRAINFNDLRVNNGNLRVDEDLNDEKGFTAELGLRGRSGAFEYDVSLYHLNYKDRIGNVLHTEPNPVFNGLVDRTVRLRTNLGDARIYGWESVAQLHVLDFLDVGGEDMELTLFGNLGITYARYHTQESGIDGNEVEQVPPITLKTGLQFRYRNLQGQLQYGFTDEHFSDATNAISSPTSVEGIIPAYQVMDLSLSYKKGKVLIESGINNLLNTSYFTRRASGYPGPGIIPANPRSFYLTVGVVL